MAKTAVAQKFANNTTALKASVLTLNFQVLMEQLPLEILKHTISFLDNKSRRNLRATNTQWLKGVDYRTFALYFTREADLPTICDRLSQYTQPLSVSFKKHFDIKTSVFLEHITRITSLTELDLPDLQPLGLADRMGPNYRAGDEFLVLSKLSNLKRLGPTPSDIQAELYSNGFDPLVICEHFSNLTSLQAFPHTKIANGRVEFASLHKIGLLAGKNSELAEIELKYNAMVLNQPFVNIFSNNKKLTKLTITSGSIQYEQINMYEHLRGLKELKVYEGGRQTPPKESNFAPFDQLTNLEKLSYTARSTMADIAKLVNLTKLRLEKLPDKLIDADWSKFFMSLSALTNLKEISLELHDTATKPIGYESDYKFLSALPLLESVKIVRHEDQQDQPMLQYLTSPHLTRLYFNAQTPRNKDKILPLPNIRELSLLWNHSAVELETLLRESQHLTKLDYFSSSVDSQLLTFTQNISTLRHLSCNYLRVNKTFSLKNLPQLEFLNPTQVLVHPSEFQHCPHLTLFQGTLVQEAGTDYSYLAQLPLKRLAVHAPIVNDQLWRAIGQLTSLVDLSLRSATDEESTALQGLVNLTKLLVSRSVSFTGRMLGTLTSLQELRLNNPAGISAELTLPYLYSK